MPGTTERGRTGGKQAAAALAVLSRVVLAADETQPAGQL